MLDFLRYVWWYIELSTCLIPMMPCFCFSLSRPSTYTHKKISKEGDSFDVPLAIAKMSSLVADTIDDGDDSDSDDSENEDCIKSVPLPNVSSEVLRKVIEFCKHYQEVEAMTPIESPLKSARLEELVQPWYASYVNMDEDTLFALVRACNFMDIKPLLDLACLAVSIVIKVRLYFEWVVS